MLADTTLLPYLPDEDFFTGKKESEMDNKWQQMKTVNKGTFTVSPNPSAQDFVLNYQADGISSMEIQLYDQSGKLVDERSSNVASKTLAWRVDSWQNGVYLIKGIDGNNQRYFAKVTVQH